MKTSLDAILAIDTSSTTATIAIRKNSDEIFFRKSSGKQKHAEFLNFAISEILLEQKIELSDVKTLLYSAGPGSFTGLRVGAALLKVLGFTNQIEIHSISTPQILAAAEGGKGLFYFLEDAQNFEKFYVAIDNLELLAPVVLLRKNVSISPPVGSMPLLRSDSFVGSVTMIDTFLRFPHLFQTFDWKSLHPLYLKASAAEELLILRK